MCHSDKTGRAIGVGGRGTGEGAYSYSADFSLSYPEEELRLKGGKGGFGSLPVPRPFFGSTATSPTGPSRAEKGKDTAPFDRTYVAPGERPWHLLDKARVREVATEYPARLLSKAERQAAARDPGLIWDEASRSYKRHDAATPPPPPAKGFGVDGEGEGEGGKNVLRPHPRRPASTTSVTANSIFVAQTEVPMLDDRHVVSPLEKLRALPPHVRAPALEVLDQLTAPLGPRELDRAFQDVGFTRTEARRFTLALKRLNVVVITPR